jgi:transcriptional regulator with XRE-family HTH domain
MTNPLAERIDCLFRTHLSPRGREFTYREAASAMSAHNGITFSSAYLWQLRTGAKDNPTIRHIEALARFFDVSPSYFFDDELTDLPEAELRLLAATKHGLPRATATSLVGLSDDSLDAVLQLTGRLRALEGLPCADGVAGNGARNGGSNGAGERNGKGHRVGSGSTASAGAL